MNTNRIFGLDQRWAVIALVGMGAVLRLAALDLHSLWLDEATSLQFARHATRGCLLAEVNNPPLFRLVLHGWIRLGPVGSDAWLRLLPALAGVLTCMAFWPLARRILERRAALVALALLVFNPYHLLFSQEVRAYSFLILLGVLALLLHLRTLERSGSWGAALAYCAVLGAGLHTHYQFAWIALVLGVHRLVVLRGRPLREVAALLAPMVVAALLFLPWLVTFWSRVASQQRGYTTDLLGRVASLPFMLLLGESAVVRQYPLSHREVVLGHLWLVIPFVLAVAPLLFWGVRSLWQRRPAGRLLLLVGGVPMVALALLFPVLPLFTARYLAFLIPVTCLVVAAAVMGDESGQGTGPGTELGTGTGGRLWPARIALGVILALQLLSLVRYHADSTFGREDWRGAARYVTRHQLPNSVIVFDKHYVRIPFDRYYRGGARRVGLPDGAQDRERLLARLAEQYDGRVVLVVSHAWDTSPRSTQVLSRHLCKRDARIFRRSNGIEVHLYGRCPTRDGALRSSIFTDGRAAFTLVQTSE
jgi:uncharacterized membrane protein